MALYQNNAKNDVIPVGFACIFQPCPGSVGDPLAPLIIDASVVDFRQGDESDATLFNTNFLGGFFNDFFGPDETPKKSDEAESKNKEAKTVNTVVPLLLVVGIIVLGVWAIRSK
jgi:hypothetical protein